MNCLRNTLTFLGLCPTDDYAERLDQHDAASCDLTKRILILVGVLLILVGIALIAATCAYHRVHPAIGVSLFLAGLIAMITGAALPSPPIEQP